MTTVVTEGVTVTEVAEAVVEDTVAAVVDVEVETGTEVVAVVEEAMEAAAAVMEEGAGA